MFHGTITKELTSHEEWSHYNENIIEDQKDFIFIKFNGLHLKSMESLQLCISLKICICSNNFITDIHPLQSCLKLVKLDLHGNQIKILPDTKFWSGMKKLKLLYLHDNGFVKLKNACVLSACPNLIALTMFDCPASLKKGYRHVLVNSIWSLKALDYHVISDEEIIQNWHLPERFRTYNHRLFFNICPSLRKGSTYEDEFNNIKHIISKINEILAHNSPVLIVQRWIRGFLARKKLSHLFLNKKQQEKFKSHCESKWIYVHKGYKDKLLKDLFLKPETDIREKLSRWKYNIHSPVDFKIPSEQRKYISSILSEIKTKDISIKSKQSRPLILKGQQENENEIEAEETDTSCRISGFKLPIQTSSPLTYVAVLKKQRQEPFPTYAPPFSAIHQKPKIKRGMLLERNARKDFFASHRTGVKLKALCDIDKYYSEQKKQESHKKRVTSVNMAQVAEERVNQTVQEFLNNKKYAAKKLIEKDNKTIQKNLQQICQDRLNYIEKVKERSALFLKEKERKATIRLLIQDLNNERTLLIQGMRKIDRCQGKEYLLKEKKQIVKQKREAEKYQKEFLKQTKEIRTQEIYKRHCEEKFVNDMLAFQNAYERFQDAKANVAIVKMNFVNVLNGMGK